MLRKDCLSGTTFQSVFVNKNNYLIKYLILVGSGLFRLPFLAVEKRYGRRGAKPDCTKNIY